MARVEARACTFESKLPALKRRLNTDMMGSSYTPMST